MELACGKGEWIKKTIKNYGLIFWREAHYRLPSLIRCSLGLTITVLSNTLLLWTGKEGRREKGNTPTPNFGVKSYRYSRRS